MIYQFTAQEMDFNLSAKGFNPSAINPDFLKYSDVIPSDWEWACPPVYTKQVMQMVFSNGISLAAQPNRIDFVEAVASKILQIFLLPVVVTQYINKLPNLECQAISSNFAGFVNFPEGESGYQYLMTHLLHSVPLFQQKVQGRAQSGSIASKQSSSFPTLKSTDSFSSHSISLIRND